MEFEFHTAESLTIVECVTTPTKSTPSSPHTLTIPIPAKIHLLKFFVRFGPFPSFVLKVPLSSYF